MVYSAHILFILYPLITTVGMPEMKDYCSSYNTVFFYPRVLLP